MTRKILFSCLFVFLFANLTMAQQSSVRIGMSAQYAYLLLSDAYEWHVNVEGYEPGSFTQLGLSAEFLISPRLSIRSGLQFGRYKYRDDQNDDLIFFDGQFLDDGPFILLPHVEEIDNNRSFNTISIPVQLQYHLEDLVPGKIRLSLAAGFSANANLSTNSDDLDRYHSSLTKYSLDGLIGPQINFLTKSGQLSVAPVLRVALTNYSNLQELDGIPFNTSRELRPYSFGLEVSYLWNL